MELSIYIEPYIVRAVALLVSHRATSPMGSEEPQRGIYMHTVRERIAPSREFNRRAFRLEWIFHVLD